MMLETSYNIPLEPKHVSMEIHQYNLKKGLSNPEIFSLKLGSSSPMGKLGPPLRQIEEFSDCIKKIISYCQKLAPSIHDYTLASVTTNHIYPFACRHMNILLASCIIENFPGMFNIKIYSARQFNQPDWVKEMKSSFDYHSFLILAELKTGRKYYLSICDVMLDVFKGKYKGELIRQDSKFIFSPELVEWAKDNQKIKFFELKEGELTNDKRLKRYLLNPKDFDYEYPPPQDIPMRLFIQGFLPYYQKSFVSSPLA